MMIKELRDKTSMTQKSFCEKYHIPLQTLKQWESSPGSSSHRNPPDYVLYMLHELIAYEYESLRDSSSKRVNELLEAAKRSRHDAYLWLRYLRKQFNNGVPLLKPYEVNRLLNDDALNMYQKISLRRAMLQQTPTNQAIIALNENARTPMLDELLRRHNDAQ